MIVSLIPVGAISNITVVTTDELREDGQFCQMGTLSNANKHASKAKCNRSDQVVREGFLRSFLLRGLGASKM